METKMTFKLPQRLNPGDKIAVLSPSAGLPYLFPWVYEQGLDRISGQFLLEPVEYPTVLKSPDFLSDNPKVRAADINAAFADPSIKAIFATIGGLDQIRILPFLDKGIISANPKIFMGYSDNTNLHLFLWNLGIISYYGGAVMCQFAMGGGMHDYTVDAIQKALFSSSIGEIYAAPEWSDVDLDWSDKENLNIKRPMHKGNGWHWHNNQNELIQGRLWGGCLEVLNMHLSVRSYLPAFEQLDDTILYIETSEEMPAEGFVYRFIASLGEIGLLQRFRAILMAYPKAQYLGNQPPEGREAFMINQQNAVISALRDYNSKIPVVFNMNFGHTDPQLIIPNGGFVSIDGAKRTIHLRNG
jgi:muramoyltetrapeptide carboxypeptidase LdcA involved in peptidoglycan recycling